jgi:membrane protein
MTQAAASSPGARFGLARLERVIRSGWRALQTALHVIEGENVRLRAMALTYISLFALVPALVVAFSVVQAFTGMDRISGKVHEFLIENLAVGARATIEPYLDRFIGNAHATSAGLVGGLLLAWSAVTLFSNVERAVNDVWGIRRRRTITQQAVIYWVGLTLGPLLLAGSVTLSSSARAFLAGTGVRFLAVAAGTLLTCTFFAVLFQILPNTKVRVRSAVAGGLAAGIAWELAKFGYTFAVGKIFRYHAIYGSVAAVPIFLLWLFVSWTILLFGARLAYLAQYASSLMGGAPAGSTAGKEFLAAQAMLLIARAYDGEEPAPDGGEVASRLGATAEDAGEALGSLRSKGLVVALADGGLVPSRPLEKITLLDVRRAVVGAAEPALGALPAGPIAGIFKGIEDQAAERLEEVTFRELCDRERGAAALALGEVPGGATVTGPGRGPAEGPSGSRAAARG